MHSVTVILVKTPLNLLRLCLNIYEFRKSVNMQHLCTSCVISSWRLNRCRMYGELTTIIITQQQHWSVLLYVMEHQVICTGSSNREWRFRRKAPWVMLHDRASYVPWRSFCSRSTNACRTSEVCYYVLHNFTSYFSLVPITRHFQRAPI